MSIISKTIKHLGPLGLYRFARFVTRNEPKILMYHRFSERGGQGYVGEDTFEKQLQYIKKHFRPVSLARLSEEIYEQKKVEPNRIAITIDDGYQDFYKFAYPLLKKYDIPATLYTTTGFIDNSNWLWPDKISWLLKSVKQPRAAFQFQELKLIDGHISDEQRKKDWSSLINYLLKIDNDTKEACIKALAKNWSLTIPENAPEQYAPCTLSQLKEMQSSGIEIGGHTVNHPSLGKVSNEVARFEILECENWLMDHLGTQPRSFCYPNGTKSDYTKDVIDIIKNESKFNSAVTAFADNLGKSNRYAIRRHSGSEEMFQFYKSITGVELQGSKIRAKFLK